MTSPGGADGTAYVEIVAAVGPNFERDLERAVKRAAKKAGEVGGVQLAKSFTLNFRRQMRADTARYFAAGAAAARAVRKGFQGEKYGRLSAQDFLRGVRRTLADADLKLPSPTGGAGGGGIDREAFAQARAAERRDLVAFRAALKEREILLRSSLDRRSRDTERSTRSLIDRLRALPFPSLGGGSAGLFSQRGLIGAGLKLSPALIPGLASLFQALRNATGALFGIFPAITAAGGAFALFSGKNTRLLAALKPVSAALDEVRVNLDGIAAAASQSGFSDLAERVIPQLRRGLEQFAGGFGTLLGDLSRNLGAAGAGESLSRALTSIGQAFQALTSGPGLTGFLRLLLRINEQVSATLPALFKRLQVFLNGLDARFAKTDFGAIFERGVQAVVDFSGALINLLRVLNAFFAAVTGAREQGTFFATLRRRLDDLVTFLQQPGTVASIDKFFEAIRQLGSAALSILPAIGFLIGKVLAISAAIVSWLDAHDALLPVLAALGAALAGVGLALFVGQLIAVVGAVLALGAPLLALIGVIAALAGAIVYANTSSSKLATVIRTVLNVAFGTMIAPIVAVTNGIKGIIEAFGIFAELAAKVPGPQRNLFREIAAGADVATRAIDRATGALINFVKIEGVAAAGGLSGALGRLKPLGEKLIRQAEAKKQADALRKLQASFKTGFSSTGPRDTSEAGGAATAKAAKQAVDLVSLMETVTSRLQDSLRQGGAETSKTFLELRKTIRNALKGTLQEGRTSAALAALAKMRSDAIAVANSYAQISKAVESTRDKLKGLKDEQDSFRQSVLDTLKASASISTFLSARPGGGVASFTRFLSKDIAKLEKFQTNLATLLRGGLDPALVRDLAAGGLDNARFAAKLAAATPAQIAAINALQKRVNELAAGTATLTAGTFQAGIDKVAALLSLQIAQQKKQEAQLNRLANGIVAGIAAAIKGKPLPKFAHGGVATRPSIFGEAGRELALPLNDRKRSDALLRQHYPPRAGDRTYSSSFVINTQPGQDPRAIAAAVDRRLAAKVR